MRRALAICAALVSTLTPAPSASAGTPTWTTAVARQPANATLQRQLTTDIACLAAGSCVIIGSYDGFVPGANLFIDTMSGGRVVSSVEPPMPRDALGPPYQNVQQLTSVSCWAVGSCVAVGTYTDSDDHQAGLIETLHDGNWTARRSPGGTGVDRALDEVACNSARCVATGSNLGASVVVRATDGTWHAQQVTAAAAAGSLQVQHASCPPTGACFLTVVADFATGHERALFGYPSGAGWHAVYFPVPPSGDPAQLRVGRLSCPVEGDCVAFGVYQEQGALRYHPIVEQFSAGQLAVSTLPTPAGYGVNADWRREGVSCGTLTRCAGYAYGGNGTLLYRLTAAGWRVQVAAEHQLAAHSVSCSAQGTCVIAGSDGHPDPYVLALTGSRWEATTLSYPRTRPAGDAGGLLDIRCVARTCVGAGDVGSSAERFFSRTLIAVGRTLPTS